MRCLCACSLLRTKVKGDFNIHGTKYFQYAVFLQKSNIYDVLSLLNLWWAKKTCSPREIQSIFGFMDVKITPDFCS